MRKFTSKLFIFVMFSVVIITMIKKYKNNQKSFRLHGSKARPGMKYILLWTKEETIPFVYMGQGRRGFIGRKCTYTNCVVTGNESLLGSTTAFDAVLFHGPELTDPHVMLPEERLPYQKFVFASIESPANYPLCTHNFNGYFNWTWTYRLDSDVRWGYIAIKDSNGHIVGPKKDMHWIKWKDMDPVNETFKAQVRSKHKAVAWFVSNCRSRSRRERYVNDLKYELMDKYELDIDVYGDCGKFSCYREEPDFCAEMISKDYYFYLSFENSFSEDYVTEKLLHALQNNAVPIVYGGANYSSDKMTLQITNQGAVCVSRLHQMGVQFSMCHANIPDADILLNPLSEIRTSSRRVMFLPERSYLNARELKISELAEMIDQLIREPATYAEFFRWHKYYSYHKTTELNETNEYCKMCAALNDEKLMNTTSVYNEFSEFWEVYNTC